LSLGPRVEIATYRQFAFTHFSESKLFPARKKSNSSGTGFLIIFALAFGTVATIPKQAWFAVGVVTCIGVVLSLLIRRTKQQRNQIVAKPPYPHERNQQPQPRGAALTFTMREVSKNEMTDESDTEFYTAQLGTLPSPNAFKIPGGSSKKKDTTWVPAGEPLTISGFSIPGGMLYVGSTSGSRYEDQKPSLINPKLQIAKTYVDLEERLMPYSPSYLSITPQARHFRMVFLDSPARLAI